MEKPKIKLLEEILFTNELTIPKYQRPYKWSTKNVNQLLDDILVHSDKIAYRLGTLVVHHDLKGNEFNVVDGQQRLLTLSLIAYELLQTEIAPKLKRFTVENLSISNVKIDNEVSINNLKRNQALIKSRIKEFTRDTILFFFEKCEFVYIKLTDISEAFQFFDSQNTRGKDLEPHDLLKAYHLRKMVGNTEEEKIQCVTKWEEVSDELHTVFDHYLYKVRQWCKGRSGLHFNKNKIGVFKGISVEDTNNYNFVQPYRISHYFTEKYNNDIYRKIDLSQRDYPFQIDMVMLDGKRFFEYVHYYANLIHKIQNIYNEKKLNASILKNVSDEEHAAHKIFELLRTYHGRNRTGDLYVKNIFDCCILYYVDKFGDHKLEKAIVKFFLWSFTPRLEKRAVKEVTADNHGKAYNGFFRTIREAVHTNDIIHKSLDLVNYVGNDKAVKNLGSIVKMFTELKAIRTNG